MLGYLSTILFLHTAISTLRWRKFVQVNQEPFFLPIDVNIKLMQIALEIILATIFAFISILVHTKKFKAVKQFTQNIRYISIYVAMMHHSSKVTSKIIEQAEHSCYCHMLNRGWVLKIFLYSSNYDLYVIALYDQVPFSLSLYHFNSLSKS